MTEYTEIPGAPAWAQEFYKRVHADVQLVLVEFLALRSRVESLEQWRLAEEAQRDTEPPPADAE